MSKSSLIIRQLNARINSELALQSIDLDVPAGTVSTVVGPNGAGKTSLLRAICGELPIQSGTVNCGGQSLADWEPAARARSVAVLPQQSTLDFPFTVEEVVQLGRIPHSCTAAVNCNIVTQALQSVDCLNLRRRHYVNLSGGEKQRVQLARVLAQIWEPQEGTLRCLLLDEPSVSLDLAHQTSTLGLIREFAQQGVAVLMVLHDLNLAAKYADQLLVLNQGRRIVHGSPADVVTEELLAEVFAVSARVDRNPLDGRPLVIL